MPEPFVVLSRFLDRYTEEVEGRAHEDPGEPVKNRLRRLARGELSGAERDEVIKLLKGNPDWIAFLAAEIKAQRPANDDPTK